MEKGKEFIYLWFIKNISDNRLEYYYNNFIKSNNVKTNISRYMNSKKFNY